MNQLQAADIDVKIVTFDSQQRAQQYRQNRKLPWPLLLDEKRQLYQGYGFERASWWRLLGPISTIKYIWLSLTGHPPGRPGQDVRQMGGDVLVDPNGVVKLHHESHTPHDRPRLCQILAAQN